jgi:hypothetical protein
MNRYCAEAILSCRGKHQVLAATIVCVCCLISCTAAIATPLAYEGFDYDPGSISGLNGGTNWSAPWGGSNLTTSAVVSGGLTYTDSNGDSLVVSGNSATTSGQSGSAQVTRALSSAGADGTTTWISYIGQRLSPHPTENENLVRAASLQVRQGSSEKLAIGKGTTAAPNVQQNWAILYGGTAANSAYSTTPHLSEAFLVVRIDHLGDASTPDNAWLWVNPLLATDPDTSAAHAEFLGLSDISFDGIRVFAGNSTGDGPYAALAFDEIRLGTEFVDVAPIALVPEPAAAVLALVGLLAASSRRKR